MSDLIEVCINPLNQRFLKHGEFRGKHSFVIIRIMQESPSIRNILKVLPRDLRFLISNNILQACIVPLVCMI